MRLFLRHVILGLLTVCCVCFSLVGFTRQDPLSVEVPELEILPNAKSEWVAKKMAYNGVPMSIRSFSIDRSAQYVLDHYSRKWRSYTKAAVKPSKQGDFDTLGLSYDGFYHTVQVRNKGRGAEGLLVVSADLTPEMTDLQTRFPLPQNTVVLSKIESLDNGVRAETITAMNRQSKSANKSFFVWSLADLGWIDQPGGEVVPASGGVQLTYQNGRDLGQVTIHENSPQAQGHTLIMVHWIK